MHLIHQAIVCAFIALVMSLIGLFEGITWMSYAAGLLGLVGLVLFIADIVEDRTALRKLHALIRRRI